MTRTTAQAGPTSELEIDSGVLDAITPRDLFRAMCIAQAMNEHGMAERLRAALQAAFDAAGVPSPEDFKAALPPLH